MDAQTKQNYSDAYQEWKDKFETHTKYLSISHNKAFTSSLLVRDILNACLPYLDPILKEKYAPILDSYNENISQFGEALSQIGLDYQELCSLYLRNMNEYKKELEEYEQMFVDLKERVDQYEKQK